ncbi:MAG: glyoxalase/bleomycin resistance/extradiol dioxygenase family protein [Cytophagales bacterium]|nr:MAG: glyoxalase/bleomycin resistance/extradiol dioxygenase family protein [Cytophagales bacterium]
MKIEHIAIWTSDLEKMRDFYCHFFGATAGQKYTNPKKNYTSYFLSFDDGARIELMHVPTIPPRKDDIYTQFRGLIHFAIAIGSEAGVNDLTEKLRNEGYEIVGEPRWTGDGYYESVVLDPENNRIEITA